MNGLSWILYLAEVAGSLRGISLFAMIGAGAAAAIVLVIGGVVWFVSHDENDEVGKGVGRRLLGYGRVFLTITVAGMFTLALVPPKQTVLLIGASQAGQQILELQEVQEIGGEAGALASDTIKLLRQMVGDQISEAEE